MKRWCNTTPTFHLLSSIFLTLFPCFMSTADATELWGDCECAQDYTEHVWKAVSIGIPALPCGMMPDQTSAALEKIVEFEFPLRVVWSSSNNTVSLRAQALLAVANTLFWQLAEKLENIGSVYFSVWLYIGFIVLLLNNQPLFPFTEEHMYTKINRFLLSHQYLDLRKVPGFFQLFYSFDFEVT